MRHVAICAMCVSTLAWFCLAGAVDREGRQPLHDVRQTRPTSRSEDADELTMIQTKLQMEHVKAVRAASEEHKRESVSISGASNGVSLRSNGSLGVSFAKVCCFEAFIDVWFYFFIPAILAWYLLYRHVKNMELPKEFSTARRAEFANKSCSALHSFVLWVAAIVIFAQYNSIGLMHGVFILSLGWHILDLFLSPRYFLPHLVVILFYVLYWKLPMQEDRPLHKFVAGMLLAEMSSTFTWHLPYFEIHYRRERAFCLMGYVKIISWITLRLVWMPFILFRWILHDPFFSKHCKFTYFYTFVGVGILWVGACFTFLRIIKKGWANFVLYGS